MSPFLLCLSILLGPRVGMTEPPASDSKKIVVLGDSIADGFGVSKEQAYPAVLEDLLRKRGIQVTVVNAGISGSTTASALSRLKWQLRDKPHLLILELGGNDGLRGVAVSASKKNLSDTIELAKQNGIRVLIAGMKLPQNYGEKYRAEFESMFRELAQKHLVGLVPFLLEGVGGKPEYNLPDGIHPNEKGHALIGAHLLPFVEKEL